MSIKAMQLVWERSKAKGTARVVMLALADHAGEDLTAYPSLDRLAKYANVDRRNIIEAVDRLVAAGEVVKVGSGRRGVNIYRIALTRDATVTSDAPVTRDEIVTPTSDESITSDEAVTGGETITSTRDEIVTPTSDESITRTVIEPPVNPQGEGERRGTVFSFSDFGMEAPTQKPDPVQAMVDQWNVLAVELGLSQVQKLTEARRKKAKARLKDCGGPEGWTVALGKVRTARWMWDGSARGGWKADFDFLMQESRFVKLMEGAYDHGAQASGQRSGAMKAAFERMKAEAEGVPA